MTEDTDMTETATHAAIDDQMLDEEWLAAPERQPRLRLILLAVLAASVFFLGGALVQKHFGTGSGASSVGAGPGGAGFPSGGQMPRGMPNGFPGAAGIDSQSTASPTDGATAGTGSKSVIGKVVEVRKDVWIVEDLGGKRYTVRVTDHAAVVRESKADRSQVKAGAAIEISGTTSDDQIEASKVTLR
jgi:hypothetical protein